MTRKRFLTHIGSTAMVVVALGVLWTMLKTTPNYTRLLAPIETRGHSGANVRGRSIVARVDGVELAHSLQHGAGDSAKTLGSGGMFVIVHLSASAVARPARVAAAALVAADGTHYLQSDRISMANGLLGNVDLQPGVESRGDLIFEVPSDALDDAELLLSAAPFGLGPLDSMLRIDSGIDHAAAEAKRASMSAVYTLGKR